MEDTRGNLQNSRNELKKSPGRQDDWPHSCTTIPISSGDSSQSKTLIEYDNDETLEIKEEIILDQERHQSGDQNLLTDKDLPEEKYIFFAKNSGCRNLIEYDNDETLEIKEEIIQDPEIHQTGDHNLLPDKHHLDEKFIFSGNNSGGRTLIEYDNDETLEIKEEIVQDQEIYQSGDCNLPEKNHLDEKSIFFSKNSGFRTLIEYDNDGTLEIEEEITQDREHRGQTYNEKYDLKLCTVDVGADDIFAVKNHQCTSMKQEIQKSNQNKENKTKTSQPRHKCAMCSQSYTTRRGLIQHEHLRHTKVKPQFVCDICGHKTSRKYNLSAHISLCHFKKPPTSQARHNCRKCSLSYSSLRALKQHDRLKHAEVKPQFTCDVCSYKTNRKHVLSTHITLHHFKKLKIPQARHNCDKCSRSYGTISALKQHYRLKHAGSVKPQFHCDACGYQTNVKCNLSVHISVRHFKKLKIPQARHNCDKCSRSYSSLRSLYRHNRLEHATVKPQFICDVCGHTTSRKYNLSTHITLCHLKKATTSQARHNCRKCSLSYSSLRALKQHDRLKHAEVKPQLFTCDVCSYKTNRKYVLSTHITSHHFKKLKIPQARHNCNKCSRSYGTISALNRHNRLTHPKE